MGTGLNFSCVPLKHHGLMANTSYSDKLSKAWMSSKRLNLLDLNRANVHKKSSLLTVANAKNFLKQKPGEYRKKRRNLREKNNPPKISLYKKKKTKFLRFLCTTEIMLIQNDSPTHL